MRCACSSSEARRSPTPTRSTRGGHRRSKSAEATAIAGPVVVVSALGGVTDYLLDVADLAQRGDAAHALALVDSSTRGISRPWPSLAPGEHGGPVPEADRRTLLAAARDCRRRRRPARSLAAVARRHCRHRRDRQQPDRHRGAVAAGIPATWADPRALIVTDDSFTSATPLDDETDGAVRGEPASRARRRPRDRHRRLRRRAPARHHHDAGPRRVRLLGVAARRGARAPTRSRSGPTSTACSPPTRASSTAPQLVP